MQDKIGHIFSVVLPGGYLRPFLPAWTIAKRPVRTIGTGLDALFSDRLEGEVETKAQAVSVNVVVVDNITHPVSVRCEGHIVCDPVFANQ